MLRTRFWPMTARPISPISAMSVCIKFVRPICYCIRVVGAWPRGHEIRSEFHEKVASNWPWRGRNRRLHGSADLCRIVQICAPSAFLAQCTAFGVSPFVRNRVLGEFVQICACFRTCWVGVSLESFVYWAVDCISTPDWAPSLRVQEVRGVFCSGWG